TRYMRLLERLEGELSDPPRADGGAVTLAAIAGGEFRRAHKKVKKLGDTPSDDALHDVRRAIKRARYAAELAEATRGRHATLFIKAAKDVQDVFGDHQDAHVAEEVLRELAGHAQGEPVYVAGMLAERQRERRRIARRAYPAAWKRLRKRGRKAW